MMVAERKAVGGEEEFSFAKSKNLPIGSQLNKLEDENGNKSFNK